MSENSRDGLLKRIGIKINKTNLLEFCKNTLETFHHARYNERKQAYMTSLVEGDSVEKFQHFIIDTEKKLNRELREKEFKFMQWVFERYKKELREDIQEKNAQL